jgi:hypothetical protein
MGRRRLLVGLAVVVAALLVVGLDGWIVHHFGRNAATKQYPDDYLNAVACPSTGQCWAVGQTGSAPGGNTLSEDRNPLLKHEQDGRWRTEPVVLDGAKGSTFQDIACPGATDCWAVGGDGSRGRTIIAHWDGTAWRLVPSPTLAVAKPHSGTDGKKSRVAKANSVGGSQLDSVSCASATACWATGGTQAHLGAVTDVFEQWNGTQWAIASTVAGGLHPQEFSCPATGFCMALGQRDGRPGAASYSGGRWTAITPPPGPAARSADTVPSLFGCASRRLCLAAFPDADLVTDVWNGRAWTPVTGAKLTYPVGLSCSGASQGPADCWLLGMTRASHPLAMRWQGQGWASVAVAATRPHSYLTGLACGSDCWAVGGQGGTRRNGVPYTNSFIAPLA